MFKQLASQKSMNVPAETGVSRLSSACTGVGGRGQSCLWKTGHFHRPLERDPLQNGHLSDTLQFSKTKFLICLRTRAGQVSTREIFYDTGEHWSTSFGQPGWAFSLSGKAWVTAWLNPLYVLEVRKRSAEIINSLRGWVREHFYFLPWQFSPTSKPETWKCAHPTPSVSPNTPFPPTILRSVWTNTGGHSCCSGVPTPSFQ